VDSQADNGRVVDKLGLEFPVLSDESLSVIEAYGVLHPRGGMSGRDIARPAIFLIGPEGRVLWRNLTENWRVRVRPETLLAAIRQNG
jgi:peroxiredoxin